jgi:hypothetical protein
MLLPTSKLETVRLPAHSCRSAGAVRLGCVFACFLASMFVATYLGNGPKHRTLDLGHSSSKDVWCSNAMTSATSKSLCGICQGIMDTIQEVRWHTNLVHHQSRKSLERSARNYCGICTELLQYLCSSIPNQASSTWDALFPIKCQSDTSSASWQSSFTLTLTSDGLETIELQFIFEVIQAPEGKSMFVTITQVTVGLFL